MIARAISIALLVVAGSLAHADTARVEGLLQRANDAFARGVDASDPGSPALREAAAAYGAVLDEGLDGARLRLNLGASFAQMGDRGRAVFHLREAARLARARSDSADARAATAALRAVTGDPGEAWPPPLATRAERGALRVVDASGASALVAVFLASWSLGWTLLALRLARVGARSPTLVILIALLLGAAAGLCVGAGAWAERRLALTGVMAAPESALRAGPGDAFPTGASGRVNPGESVRVLEARDGWARVRTRSGSEGWVEDASVLRR